MPRSISIVEYKVQQTHYFLKKITEVEVDIFAGQCFIDAFVCAARSITFAMQSVITDVPGFTEWYNLKKKALIDNPLCQFFNKYRTITTHIGDTVLRVGEYYKNEKGQRLHKYYFLSIPDLSSVPEGDVAVICTAYFTVLLDLVFQAIEQFKYQLDDRWYYTLDNFTRMRKSIDDADEELGLPRGWTAIGGVFSESERWKALRRTQTIGCQLNKLFTIYLNKSIPGPDE